MQTCPQCLKQFDPADRATAITNDGAGAQIVYCSVKCKRQAGNRRNYQRHRTERLAKAKARTSKRSRL